MIPLQMLRTTNFRYLCPISPRDIYVKQPFRVGVSSCTNNTSPKIKVTQENNEISIDMNDKKENREQVHAWIEENHCFFQTIFPCM